MDDGVVFRSTPVFERLNELIAKDPSLLVVSYATRDLSFFAEDNNRREIVQTLLSVLDRPIEINWRDEYGEEQHPHDAAVYSLEDALGSEIIGRKSEGVVALACPPRFDLVVASAREFLQSDSSKSTKSDIATENKSDLSSG